MGTGHTDFHNHIADCSSTENTQKTPADNTLSDKLHGLMSSLKLLFDNNNAPLSSADINTPSGKSAKSRASTSDSYSSTQSDFSDVSNLRSSGYHSLEASWDVDDSYIKVAKFTEDTGEDESGYYGTYKEFKEMDIQQKLASEIRAIIEGENDEQLNIKISDFLALRTAGDVMKLSKYEPYGLKGCKLIVIIEDGCRTHNLGTIFPEKGIISTFEITLVLHLRRNPCRRLPFINCQSKELQVIEQYELRKEKMYTGKQRRMSPSHVRL